MKKRKFIIKRTSLFVSSYKKIIFLARSLEEVYDSPH